MNRSFEELTSRVLDRDATPAELEEFENRLREDPALAGVLHQQLRTDAALRGLAPGHDRFVEDIVAHGRALGTEAPDEFLIGLQQRIRRRRLKRVALPLAACLALAATLFVIWRADTVPEPPTAPSIATLIRFGSEDHPTGSRDVRPGETLELESGRAKLRFESGAVVTLEAPASLHVRNAMDIDLIAGRLVGWCPPEARGFRIHTGETLLTDLGTTFGLTATGHEPEVTVFDGMVRLERGPESRIVRAGESLRPDETHEGLNPVPFITAPFASSWTLSEGIVATTGALRPAKPDLPSRISKQRDDEHILVFPERRHLILDQPLEAELVTPGRHAPETLYPTTRTVPAQDSARVNSYLIHSQVKRPLSDRYDHVRYEGSVTFDAPVIAVFSSRDTLAHTDPMFAHNGGVPDYADNPHRGMDPNRAISTPDVISLSPDRLTLHLDFHTGVSIDEVRVLTRTTPQSDL